MLGLFNGWESLLRTFVVGVLAYVALILILRVSGKRTLAQMNAFDWVVTVALGSMLANVFLSPDVALAEGVLGLATLVGLQWVVAYLSVHNRTVRTLVKSEPRLVVYRGEVLEAAAEAERLAPEEIRQAVRSQGHASLEDVDVVLETDGSFSVMRRSEGRPPSALEDVRDQAPRER